MTETDWKNFRELSKNIVFSIFVVMVFLLPFGLYPPAWILVVSICASYVLSDYIVNFFVNGGQGWAKIFISNDFANKGHAYLIFFFSIIAGTLASTIILDAILGHLQTPDIGLWTETVLVGNAIVAVLVAVDVQWRFYKR